MKKLLRILVFCLVLVGLAITVVNFATPDLRAGFVEREGTFPGDRLICPNEPSDCVHRIYIED